MTPLLMVHNRVSQSCKGWNTWNYILGACSTKCSRQSDLTYTLEKKKLKLTTITVEKSDLRKLREFTKNTQWLLENIDALRSKYPDQYVAVFDSGKQLLDGQTMEELVRKILQRGIERTTCAIDFVTREPYLLIV